MKLLKYYLRVRIELKQNRKAIKSLMLEKAKANIMHYEMEKRMDERNDNLTNICRSLQDALKESRDNAEFYKRQLTKERQQFEKMNDEIVSFEKKVKRLEDQIEWSKRDSKRDEERIAELEYLLKQNGLMFNMGDEGEKSEATKRREKIYKKLGNNNVLAINGLSQPAHLDLFNKTKYYDAHIPPNPFDKTIEQRIAESLSRVNVATQHNYNGVVRCMPPNPLPYDEPVAMFGNENPYFNNWVAHMNNRKTAKVETKDGQFVQTDLFDFEVVEDDDKHES